VSLRCMHCRCSCKKAHFKYKQWLAEESVSHWVSNWSAWGPIWGWVGHILPNFCKGMEILILWYICTYVYARIIIFTAYIKMIDCMTSYNFAMYQTVQ